MVLAAALISFAVLTPTSPTQPSSGDDPMPYTLEGVRRALQAQTVVQPPVSSASVTRDRAGYRMAIASGAQPNSPCSIMATACGPAWEMPVYPTWHEQFLAMTGPQNYSVPYTAMNTVQTIQAVASSIGIGLAIQAIASAIQHQIAGYSLSRKQKKIDKFREEIVGELAELERLNASTRKAPGPRP